MTAINDDIEIVELLRACAKGGGPTLVASLDRAADEIETLRSLIWLVTDAVDTEDPGWFLINKRTFSISTDDLGVIQRALGSGSEATT